MLGLGKNVVVNADVVEQLNEIHNNISRLANHTLTSDEDRKAAEYECQVAEQLRQNQEQFIQQEAERITREVFPHSFYNLFIMTFSMIKAPQNALRRFCR